MKFFIFIIAVLFSLLIHHSAAFAYGAIASWTPGGRSDVASVYSAVVNQTSPEEAADLARATCNRRYAQGRIECLLTHEFNDTCAAIVRPPRHMHIWFNADSAAIAEVTVAQECHNKGLACAKPTVACDHTPPAAYIPRPAPQLQQTSETARAPFRFGELGTGSATGDIIGLIVIAALIAASLGYVGSTHTLQQPQHATVSQSKSQFADARPSTQPPLQASIDSPPTHGLLLHLAQNQRESMFGNVIFVLDARIQPNSEQLELIRKYNLGRLVVYESKAHKHHQGYAAAHFDNAASGAGAKSLGKGVFRAAAALLTLKCTVNSMMRGHHIECKDLAELEFAKDAMHQACESIKGYLASAGSYDGREEVREF